MMPFRLHVPGAPSQRRRCWDVGHALRSAQTLAARLRRPVHIIDTRRGGGLVTVIHPPGSWDGRWAKGALLDEALS